MSGVVMQIVGLINGGATPFDGQWLVEYDPERDGYAPDGAPMLAHIVTTPDINQARVFADHAEALELWRSTCKRHPIRFDGRSNRPLTAFTVEIAPPEKFPARA
jgi:hypothetical protein